MSSTLRKRNSKLVLSALLLGMTVLSACSSDTGSKPDAAGETSGPASTSTTTETAKTKVDGGEIITAYLSEPQGFIRLWATTTTSSEVTELVFSYLYKLNENQEIVPDLATGMPVFSDDKMTMTIKIRKDAKFTDGEPLTADDVVFTYNVALSPDYTGPRKGTFSELSKVEKVDEETIKFTFKTPFAGYIDLFPYNILPEHLLKDVPIKELNQSEFYKKPIGSGPYKLVEWKTGQYLAFTRNEDYYRGKPAIEKITAKIIPDANSMMAQLQTGEINVIGVPADQLSVIEQAAKTSGKIKLQKGIVTTSYSFIGWNLTNPLFADKKIRQALTMSIDRQGIIDGVAEGQGKIMHGQTVPSYWTYSDNVPKFPYDVEKAKKSFEEAGWKDTNGDGLLDKDGKTFEFEMQVNQGNKIREKAVTVIQQQLKKVGININIRVVEGSAFTKNFQEKKFESIYYAWNITGDPNPKGIWHSAEIEHGLNTVSYSNPQVDQLIEEDLQSFDKSKRKELLAKVDAQIAEDQPYTFLYTPTTVMAYPSNLEGFNPLRDSLKEVEKWYFTK
ncbi:peptide-binding protein [Paenibacillus turpanensis]|uniref:peptide-binding protein n=1 Tax=Paenibacillus turpanensis TaxID=2689078 RepID=UPI00140CBE2D|nr:peptide-binding protein [Paenibacillus turpanensis]